MRRTIQDTAARIDQLDVLHLRSIRGALKHHVFEKVGKAAAAARFQTETNLVVDADRNDGRRRVWRDDHFQAVDEGRTLHWNLQSLHACPPVALALGFLLAAFSS